MEAKPGVASKANSPQRLNAKEQLAFSLQIWKLGSVFLSVLSLKYVGFSLTNQLRIFIIIKRDSHNPICQLVAYLSQANCDVPAVDCEESLDVDHHPLFARSQSPQYS